MKGWANAGNQSEETKTSSGNEVTVYTQSCTVHHIILHQGGWNISTTEVRTWNYNVLGNHPENDINIEDISTTKRCKLIENIYGDLAIVFNK